MGRQARYRYRYGQLGMGTGAGMGSWIRGTRYGQLGTGTSKVRVQVWAAGYRVQGTSASMSTQVQVRV